MTEPPKPPPSRRAPYAPASRELDEQVDLGDRDLVVVAQARVAGEQQRSGCGEVAALERLGEVEDAPVLGHDMAQPLLRERVQLVEVGRVDLGRALGPDEPQRVLELAPPVGVARALVAVRDAPSRRRRAQPAPAPVRTGSSSVPQSSRIASPSRPSTEAAWSRIPHGTPTARNSARWQASASANGSSSKPATAQSASATDTSSAADDERPAPVGRSERTVPVRPTGGRPSRSSSTATACAYLAHPVSRAPPPSAGNGAAAPACSEESEISGPLRAPRPRRRTGSRPAGRAHRCSRCAHRSG